MPLDSRIVGEPMPEIEMEVTPRMVLAYSAGIGEQSKATWDDAAPDFVASPFFCVTPEWQFVIAARNQILGLAPEEAIRGVHAGQATRFLAPMRPKSRVRVSGVIVAVRQTRAGALSTTRMDLTDIETGVHIASTRSDGMYRGVSVAGGDRAGEPAPPAGNPVAAGPWTEKTIGFDRWFAHRYTECAAIWNPTHTEQRVALAAGLPGTIVHGTALWALAGMTIAGFYAAGRTNWLTSLGGRFTAMVEAGTPITVRHARVVGDPSAVTFAVLNSRGESAVSAGIAHLAQD